MSSFIDLDFLSHDLRLEVMENIMRKDFTESEKAHIADLLRPHIKKQSKQGSHNQLSKSKHDTSVNAKIGFVLGDSEETIRKREKVFKNIDEKTKKALDSGEKSLNSLHTQIVIKENKGKSSPPLPIGKFTDIVTDDGWDFGNKNIGGSGTSGAAFKYKTELTNVLARIPISSIAAKNSVLYQWTTNQHLITGSMLMSEYYEILNEEKLRKFCEKTNEKDKIKKLQEQIKTENESLSDIFKKQKVQSDALSVMHCRGFTPKCIITWEKEEKNGWGGYWINNVTEQLLIGIRGDISAFGLSEETIIKSKYVPRSHSRKPEESWKLIEKCVSVVKGNHRKLEMNCRTPRKGWYPHGDEITSKDIKKWQKLK